MKSVRSLKRENGDHLRGHDKRPVEHSRGVSRSQIAMTGTGKSFAALGYVALLTVGGPSIADAQFGALTPEEIEEAIDLGMSEEPDPYMIPSVGVGGGGMGMSRSLLISARADGSFGHR